MELLSASPGETEAIAGRLAAQLAPGDVISVSGELGAGKTTFVRGACRALGVTQPVTSPTFTIGHRYHGRVDVSHRARDRFTGVSAAEWGALEPYFAGNDLPPVRARITLSHVDQSHRRVALDGPADLLQRLHS